MAGLLLIESSYCQHISIEALVVAESSPEKESIWPSPIYYQQLDLLRQAIGQTVYLAEINMTQINAGVKLSDQAYVLLAVIDFPRPDPYQQLCPHMLILDDGRGINLGRLARVTQHSAFNPSPEDILYENQVFVQEMLFAPRVLSRASLTATSKTLLADIFGDTPGQLLESIPKACALPATKTKQLQ